MNNYDKTELLLDGLDVAGLYLEDVFSVWQHFDRNAYPYLTIFMIDNSRITVPATAGNLQLLQTSYPISEFVFLQDRMQELPLQVFDDSFANTAGE